MSLTAPHLTQLESAGLIHLAQAMPEVEYLFRHALIQDAAYGVLLLNDRKQLHQAVGEALEQHFSARLDEIAPVLGYHFARAGDDERALRYFTLAGDAAGRAYALTEAIAHYSRAIELARQADNSSSTQLRHLFSRRGNAFFSGMQVDQAWRNFVEMAEVAQQRQDESLQLYSLIEQATLKALFNPLFQPADAIKLSNQALALAQKLGDREAQAKILWNLMRVEAVVGDGEVAIGHGEQSLALARELGLREQEAFTLNDLEFAYHSAGQFGRVLETLAEARQMWQAQNNLHMLATCLNRTAVLHLMLGDFDGSLALVQEAHDLSQASGNRLQIAVSAWTRGRIAAERGDAIEALSNLEPLFPVPGLGHLGRTVAVAIYQNYGAIEGALVMAWAAFRAVRGTPQELIFGGRMTARIVYLMALKGELIEAESTLQLHDLHYKQNLKELFGQGDEASFLAEAELGMRRGAYHRVVRLMADFLVVFRSQGLYCYLAEALYTQSRALLALGQLEPAYEALTEARVTAETRQQRRVLWPILASLSQLERQRGNEAEAQRWAEQARIVITYLADHAPADLRASFLALPQVEEIMRRDA